MKIFVDADSCPRQIREIIARAASREGIVTVFAANRNIPLPDNELLMMEVVETGEGKADNYLIETAGPGDLAVTRDIPLAAELVERGVRALNDRGDIFTTENIRERLSIRNLMKDFRESGIMHEGDRSFGRKEIKLFSDAFDRELRKLLKNRQNELSGGKE